MLIFQRNHRPTPLPPCYQTREQYYRLRHELRADPTDPRRRLFGPVLGLGDWRAQDYRLCVRGFWQAGIAGPLGVLP